MNTPRRIAWLLVILGLGLFLGILFRGFIFTNLVMPIALVLWLLWRVVQSVHQALYWGLLILAGGGLAFYRLVQITGAAGDEPLPAPVDVYVKSVHYWRTSILATDSGSVTSTTLKRNLGRLLVSVYASKYPEARPYDLFEALRSRELPMPPRVHTFLFPEEASPAGPWWQRGLERLAEAPRRWIRQSTGRDRAEYYRAMEETLKFMEDLMEIKHADEFKPTDH
jgi:hypothetical protein